MSRALIVVDVQNDFCEGGSLPVTGGVAVAGEIARYVADGSGGAQYTVATRDYHVDPGSHFGTPPDGPDYVNTWPVHCVVGTDGAAFHPAVAQLPFDAEFRKGEHAAASPASKARRLTERRWLTGCGSTTLRTWTSSASRPTTACARRRWTRYAKALRQGCCWIRRPPSRPRRWPRLSRTSRTPESRPSHP